MPKQILKQLTLLMIVIAFNSPAWGQETMTIETQAEYQESELNEAMDALNEKGMRLFEENESDKNCQLQIVSEYTIVAWIMKPRFLKKIKKRGQLVTFTFERVECTGAECAKFKIKGFFDLVSGEKKVEEVEASKKNNARFSRVAQALGSLAGSGNSDSQANEDEEKKKPIRPAKPISSVGALVNPINMDIVSLEHDYRLQVVCKDDEKLPITKD